MYFRSRKINFNEILTEDITICVLLLVFTKLATVTKEKWLKPP